jgi:hypothetical protein
MKFIEIYNNENMAEYAMNAESIEAIYLSETMGNKYFVNCHTKECKHLRLSIVYDNKDDCLIKYCSILKFLNN